MKTINHEVDFCVVGGGLAGLCAALAAARHGMRVIVMQDRPVLGGNASSEIRMWICGADRSDGKGLRETGIIEEIELENLYRNPRANYSIWDSVLYGKAREQENLTLLLNCSCNEAQMDHNTIISVKGWQGTAEMWHIVKAKMFADCSGDSILAPLTGANVRIGREASGEFDESIEPEISDKKTMGLSCLIQTREHDKKVKFTPPTWAWDISKDSSISLEHRNADIKSGTNYWWLELGGENDSIHDTEKLRDELVALGLGVWDYIKNSGKYDSANYSLEWIGFLPGKRESRRYIGDHIMTQNDVESGGKFDDIVAYGGWSMDDHHPAGMRYKDEPTIFHPAPQPYGIPYRSLYSNNITNLYCAGRNISATHAAMSSTRVMGTCAIVGQAVGCASSIAIKNNVTPRDIYNSYIVELQDMLLDDDCYLPDKKRRISDLTLSAKLKADTGNPSMLIDGVDRRLEGKHSWTGSEVTLEFDDTVEINNVRLVFDSHLERTYKNMPCRYFLNEYSFTPPDSLAKDFDIEVLKNGTWQVVSKMRDNHNRLMRLPINENCDAVRIKLLSNWAGEDKSTLFAFEVK